MTQLRPDHIIPNYFNQHPGVPDVLGISAGCCPVAHHQQPGANILVQIILCCTLAAV